MVWHLGQAYGQDLRDRVLSPTCKIHLTSLGAVDGALNRFSSALFGDNAPVVSPGWRKLEDGTHHGIQLQAQ